MSEYLLIVVLAIIALGAVAFPLLVGRERFAEESALDEEVLRYREALDANTVCPSCRAANPPESAFCGECGRELEVGSQE